MLEPLRRDSPKILAESVVHNHICGEAPEAHGQIYGEALPAVVLDLVEKLVYPVLDPGLDLGDGASGEVAGVCAPAALGTRRIEDVEQAALDGAGIVKVPVLLELGANAEDPETLLAGIPPVRIATP